MQCDRLMLMVGLSFLTLSRWLTTDYRRFMIIPMLCVTIFVILVVWFLLPRVARLMIHTPTAISIFVCLSMVQLMAVFISMRCTLCGHFLQVALTLILVVGYAIAARDRKSGSAGMPRPISYAVFCLKKKKNQVARGVAQPKLARVGRIRHDLER